MNIQAPAPPTSASRRRWLAALGLVMSAAWRSAPAGGTTPQRVAIALGDGVVHLEEQDSGRAGLSFLNLHENEDTSVRAAQDLLAAGHGGRLWVLRSAGQRLLHFRVQQRRHAVDPNRIFSETGRAATLRRYSTDTPAARTALASFAQALLGHVYPSTEASSRRSPLVALHNNASGRYALSSYQPGGDLASDAEAVAASAAHPASDFFLVTRPDHFAHLRSAGFSVVLQLAGARDDGSLSVWCQRQGRAYINVEAGVGRLKEQRRMLQALLPFA